MLVHQQLNATNTAVNVDANQTTPVKNVTVAHPATTDTPPALHVAVTKKVPDHRTVIWEPDNVVVSPCIPDSYVIGVSPDFMVSPTVNVAIVIQPVPKMNVDDKLVIVVQAEM